MRELDDPLARALAEVRDEVAGYVRLPGSAAAVAALRRRRRYQMLAVGVLVVVLALGLSTLVTLGRGAGPAPGGAAGADPTTAAVWHDFVACARAHGVPDWPDPRFGPDGKPGFPSTFDYEGHFDLVKGPCAYLLQQLPPEVRQPGQQPR
jgi:hypothetical protein